MSGPRRSARGGASCSMPSVPKLSPAAASRTNDGSWDVETCTFYGNECTCNTRSPARGRVGRMAPGRGLHLECLPMKKKVGTASHFEKKMRGKILPAHQMWTCDADLEAGDTRISFERTILLVSSCRHAAYRLGGLSGNCRGRKSTRKQ